MIPMSTYPRNVSDEEAPSGSWHNEREVCILMNPARKKKMYSTYQERAIQQVFRDTRVKCSLFRATICAQSIKIKQTSLIIMLWTKPFKKKYFCTLQRLWVLIFAHRTFISLMPFTDKFSSSLSPERQQGFGRPQQDRVNRRFWICMTKERSFILSLYLSLLLGLSNFSVGMCPAWCVLAEHWLHTINLRIPVHSLSTFVSKQESGLSLEGCTTLWEGSASRSHVSRSGLSELCVLRGTRISSPLFMSWVWLRGKAQVSYITVSKHLN